MVSPITRDGRVYTPLFRTHASYHKPEESSYYYLHRETGRGYRIRFDRREFHEVFLGMMTVENFTVTGGFETVRYIQEHEGEFPSFFPQLGLDLIKRFDIPRRLVYPCGLVMYDNTPFLLSEVIELLDKEKIVLKKPVSGDLQFHYSDALVEMYDIYNPLDYLQP